MKPKSRPQRRSVEQEPAKDDEARLETFERATPRRNTTRSRAPIHPTVLPRRTSGRTRMIKYRDLDHRAMTLDAGLEHILHRTRPPILGKNLDLGVT